MVNRRAKGWIRVYRLALRMLPAELRRKHGSAMEALFGRELERARSRGRARGALAAARGVWDVVQRGAYERLRRRETGRWTIPMDVDILFVRPIRSAFNSLLKAPGYTATALLSVGGAIGMCCSVYAVIVAIYFTAPPFEAPDRIMQFWQTAGPESSRPQDYIQPARMEEWVRAGDFRTLEAVAATGMGPTLVLRAPDGATRVRSAPVLGDWFGLLGVDAARGRVLTLDDLRPGAAPAAVVSDGFWREHLSGGELRDIVLSGVGYRVVGVMPASFSSERAVWVPVESLPEDLRPAAYAGLGRLRAAASPQDAAAEVEHLASVQVAADSGRYAGLGATARPLGELGRGDRPALWVLAGVVLAVLLVALNNLTVLTLVRAQARSASLAVRASLGASRWELGRGLAVEGAVIGLAGSVLGIVLTVWGKDAAQAFLGGIWTSPTLGAGVVALALGLGILTSVMIGLEPLRRIGSLNLQALLQRRSAGATSTAGERRTRQLLVGAQVTTCVVLLAVASVLGTAYRGLGAVDVGLDVEGLIEVLPDWDVAEMEGAEQWSVAERVVRRLEGVPDLEGATAWREVGEDYPARPEFDAVTDGPTVELDRFDRLYRYYEVRPGFFGILGVELLRGRGFTIRDGRGSAPVAVVTEQAAEAWWPDLDPLGRQIKLGQGGQWMTVIGVVDDLYPLHELGRTVAIRGRLMPLLFLPVGQFDRPPVGWRQFGCCAGVRVGARAASRGGEAVGTVRSVVAQEAPDLPLVRVASIFDTQMDGYVGRSISSLAGVVAFGVLVALLLSMVGIAGVVGEAVTRRTHEIGVRVALGAHAAHVTWVVVRESLATALAGVAAALFLMLLLRDWMSGAVFEIYVQWLVPDLVSLEILALAAGVAVITTLFSAQVAARRALRINPVEALRAA